MSSGIRLQIRERSGILPVMGKRKNPAAVMLGRRGGKKGGPARAAKMTPEERTASAQKAAAARWARHGLNLGRNATQ